MTQPLCSVDAVAANPDTWVVVPAYNEATVVRSVLTDISRHFSKIVAVDDGSRDGTADEIRASGVYLVRHCANLGAGAATQTGIDFALQDRTARYFVTIDADGQHDPRDAARMVDRLRTGDAAILFGSRFLGEASGMPASRRAVLRAARLFERTMTGLELSDPHNGLRAFVRDFALQLRLTVGGFAHASEVLDRVRTSGLEFAEHPVAVQYTPYSRAKGQKSINAINIAVDTCLRHLLRVSE